MLYDDNAMVDAHIKWHRCFKLGWESIDSDPHSGRPLVIRTHENVERAGFIKELGEEVWSPENIQPFLTFQLFSHYILLCDLLTRHHIVQVCW